MEPKRDDKRLHVQIENKVVVPDSCKNIKKAEKLAKSSNETIKSKQ